MGERRTPDLRRYTLAVGAVAERLGVDTSTVWRMGERGQISFATTPCRHRRYLPAEVEDIAVRLERGERIAPVRGRR